MKLVHDLLAAGLTLGAVSHFTAAEPQPAESPADHLPPHIRRVTGFGERAEMARCGADLILPATADLTEVVLK